MQRSSGSLRSYCDMAAEMAVTFWYMLAEACVLAYRAVAEAVIRVIRVVVGIPIDIVVDILAALGLLTAISLWCRKCEDRSPMIFIRLGWLVEGLLTGAGMIFCLDRLFKASSATAVFVGGVGLGCGCIGYGLGIRGLLMVRSIRVVEQKMSKVSVLM